MVRSKVGTEVCVRSDAGCPVNHAIRIQGDKLRMYVSMIVCIVLRHDATVASCKSLYITTYSAAPFRYSCTTSKFKDFFAVCSKRMSAFYPERRNI